MFIDTHCHLSKEDYDNIDTVLSDNREAGIEKIIISGCTRESIIESLLFVDQYEDVYTTIGYHPSEASFTTEEDLIKLEEQIQHPKVVGIGEIGLDYHYGKEDKDLQQELFRRQLFMADRHHLPVVIHSRDATEDTISILKEFPNVVGVIHCFSGSLETARIYLSMGYYLGIGGVVTFKNSQLGDVIQAIGLSSILLETDSPYLAPEPYRGSLNSSKYIPFIAKKLSEILSISVEEVSQITLQNTHTLFDFQ
ncbi:MAG: TatD family hydrolase [Bacilli bacterium]|nr:TatD family hydrolase [Bacilli bacterium]